MSTPVFVTGAPRSGTSWLGEQLARVVGARYVYEPLNFQWNRRLKGRLGHFEYFGAGASPAPPIRDSADRAFSGSQSLRQMARGFYRGYWRSALGRTQQLVVKDPTALLMADWIEQVYAARTVAIIRHPCGFASSIMALQWNLNPANFLRQPQLMEDYLAGHEALLRQAGADPWARAGAFWSAVNTVLVRQHEISGKRLLCRYEALCASPATEFGTLARQLGLRLRQGQDVSSPREMSSADAADPGSTTRNSSDMADIWRDRLTPAQIDVVHGIVTDFGLGHLYPRD